MPKFVVNGFVEQGVHTTIEANNPVEALKKAIKLNDEGLLNWEDGAWESPVMDINIQSENGTEVLAGRADLSKYIIKKYGVI